MVLGALYLSLFIPLSIQSAHAAQIDINKPYLVMAVLDSVRIIGLPSSKAAKAHALKIQSIDPSLWQIIVAPEPVSDRKLFFRNYFK